MKAIWDWLNGNKTTIGSILIAVAGHLPSDLEVVGISVTSVLYWVGGMLGGIGVGHKIKKKISS